MGTNLFTEQKEIDLDTLEGASLHALGEQGSGGVVISKEKRASKRLIDHGDWQSSFGLFLTYETIEDQNTDG